MHGAPTGVTVLAAAAPACRLSLAWRGTAGVNRGVGRAFVDVLVLGFCALLLLVGTAAAVADIADAY